MQRRRPGTRGGRLVARQPPSLNDERAPYRAIWRADEVTRPSSLLACTRWHVHLNHTAKRRRTLRPTYDRCCVMTLDEYLKHMHKVPGWCSPVDAELLVAFGDALRGSQGHVLEIGAFKGKSAAVLGFTTEPSRLIVCDPMLEPGLHSSTREDFERLYSAVHGCTPVTYTCMSAELDAVISPGTVRLAHVDGDHSYEGVRTDIALTRALLMPGGIVAFDDFHNLWGPGCVRAIWEAVAHGLVPLVLGAEKMLATWDANAWPQERIADLLRAAQFEPLPLSIGDRDVFRPIRRPSLRDRVIRSAIPPGISRRLSIVTGRPSRAMERSWRAAQRF